MAETVAEGAPTADSLVGRTGKPYQLVVELGKIREFARATKSRNAAYDGGPGDRPVSPVTFLISSAFWSRSGADPLSGVPINWARVLHGEQEFVFHGDPPRAGSVLTSLGRIDKVYEKDGKRGGTMRFIETVTEYRDETGRLVAESRGTLLETSKATTEG